MKYREYQGGNIVYDETLRVFRGRILNIADIITFQGTDPDLLEEAFQDSVDQYLDFCREIKKKPQKSFSGKFVVRIDPALHREAYFTAKNQGNSLNGFVREAIADALKKYDTE
ncbi:MAG: type II toxin-antitoxin system HicB family antitoxin [Alphaproteobacteria bacterium]